MNRLETNLRLYGPHQSLAGALFWMPTMVLFLIEQTGLTTALSIQAAYYFSVVVLELPSGWLSDRVGRVISLRIVGVSWLSAHLLFASSPGTIGLITAQVLLAAGYAFLSGTDVTFHYETLEALGRAGEFEQREASARQRLLVVTAASALGGGLLGAIDLRLPFLASAAFAGVQALLTLRLSEPSTAATMTDAGGVDASSVFAYLRRAPLLWLTVFIAAQVIAVHLIADLSGPYLATATGDAEPTDAAFATGASAAAAALMGALFVRRVPALRELIGAGAVLLTTAFVPIVVLTTMASFSSLWVLPILTVRSVPTAAVAVIAPALAGRYVARRHRASYLSLASLGGRLGFGAMLLVLGSSNGSLTASLGIAAVVVAVLWVTVAALMRLATDASDFATGPGEPGSQTHDHLHVHWGSHDHQHPLGHGRFFGVHRHDHVHDHSGAD